MSQNGLKAYNRIKWIGNPLLSAAALNGNPTIGPLDCTGFSGILFFIQYTHSAATTVTITSTGQHPNATSGGTPVEHQDTADVFDSSGVGTRAQYVDTTAVSANKNFKALIPITGGNETFTFGGASAGAGDLVTVYAALVS